MSGAKKWRHFFPGGLKLITHWSNTKLCAQLFQFHNFLFSCTLLAMIINVLWSLYTSCWGTCWPKLLGIQNGYLFWIPPEHVDSENIKKKKSESTCFGVSKISNHFLFQAICVNKSLSMMCIVHYHMCVNYICQKKSSYKSWLEFVRMSFISKFFFQAHIIVTYWL
jgi:hypothetical protein